MPPAEAVSPSDRSARPRHTPPQRPAPVPPGWPPRHAIREPEPAFAAGATCLTGPTARCRDGAHWPHATGPERPPPLPRAARLARALPETAAPPRRGSRPGTRPSTASRRGAKAATPDAPEPPRSGLYAFGRCEGNSSGPAGVRQDTAPRTDPIGTRFLKVAHAARCGSFRLHLRALTHLFPPFTSVPSPAPAAGGVRQWKRRWNRHLVTVWAIGGSGQATKRPDDNAGPCPSSRRPPAAAMETDHAEGHFRKRGGRRPSRSGPARRGCSPGRRAGSAPAPPSVRLPRRRERNGKKAVQAGSGAPRAAAALLLFSALLPTPAEAEPAAALLGDSGGLRTVLARYGAALDLSETSEVFGNLTGGLHRGFAYDGLTSMALTLDAGKAFGWTGGTFHVSAFQIHGLNLTARNLDVLQTISNIEADRATRLWELWYRQTLPGMDADVKFGQQSVDQEFLVSDYAGLFINAMNGWPALPSNDLYAGGPVYPLSSLGIRLRAKPAMGLTVLAGVFDDNPPGGSFFNDLQVRDGEASGTRFN